VVETFQSIDNEAKAYWLGFIYADGNVSSRDNSLTVGVSFEDGEHLSKLANLFNKEVKYYTHFSKICNKDLKRAQFQICNKTLKSNMIRNGVFPRKTYIDSDYIFECIPSHLVNHFIRGYFDGDGSVTGKGKDVSFSFCGVEKFLTRIKNEVCSRVGLSDVAILHKKGICTLTWRGRIQLIAMKEWMYKDANIWLDRKYDRFVLLSKKTFPRGSSQYRGVSWCKTRNRWLASINDNGKQKVVGRYLKEIDAAKAYDKAVTDMNKPKYRLNFGNTNEIGLGLDGSISGTAGA